MYRQPLGWRTWSARIASRVSLLILLPLGIPPLAAQTLEQVVELEPGWNAISIDVELSSTRPADVFSSVAYRSVWAHLEPDSPSEPGRWLSHRAEGPDFLDTLRELQAGRSYLVDCAEASTLRLVGRPIRRAATLTPERHALVSPSVDPSSPPTFEDAFAGLDGGARSIVELRDGEYREVSPGERTAASRAYWVLSERPVADAQPLRVRTDGLRFDERVATQELVVEVEPREARSLRITPLDSTSEETFVDWLDLAAPGGEFAPLGPGADLSVPQGATSVVIRLRGVSDEITPSGQPTSPVDPVVLAITDPAGNRALVPAALDAATVDGVWIGSATLAAVSETSPLGGDVTAAPSFRLSLILEVEDDGASARLLDHVVTASGTTPQRRLDALGFHAPVSLSGALGPDGESGSVSGRLVIERDHALHPHRHRYHPEHREAFDVERLITLAFTGDVPGSPVGSSVGALSGTYAEEIRGLSLDPLVVRGTFRLFRLAPETVVSSSAAALGKD